MDLLIVVRSVLIAALIASTLWSQPAPPPGSGTTTSVTYYATYTLNGGAASLSNQTYSASATDTTGVWVTNDGNDGLPSDMAYSLIEDRRGRVWAGATLGLSMYHPEADPDPPRTFLSTTENQSKVAPDGHARIVFSHGL